MKCYYFLLLLIPSIVECSNILFYFGVSSYSHRIIVWPLVQKLAQNHSVTFISPYLPKPEHLDSKVIEITPPGLSQFMADQFGSSSDLLSNRIKGDILAPWRSLTFLGLESCEIVLKELSSWIESNNFDLVIQDALYCECGFGLAHKFGAKTIIFDTTSIFPWGYDEAGIPYQSSWIPDIRFGYDSNMDFLTRIKNTLLPVSTYFYREWFYKPQIETVLRNGLNISDLNPLNLKEIEKKVQLTLINTHYTTDYARSLPPSFIPIGGIVVANQKKTSLPSEIENFINKTDSFIYISYGSAVQISKMTPDYQAVYFNTLRKLKDKFFIWKWEGETPSQMPPNVFTQKWMPQNEILSHPKCKAFITHGGLGGIHEAMFSGVPLIVMPVFAEQDYNAQRTEKVGFGIRVEIVGLTENVLRDAILKITTNDSYRRKMREISESFKNRQNSPLDTAHWWVEKVLKSSSDTEYLLKRSLAADQPWLIRNSLDVWLTLFSIFILITSLGFILIAKILKNLIIQLLAQVKNESRNEDEKYDINLNKIKTN